MEPQQNQGMNPTQSQPEVKQSGVGAIIGTVIVIALIVLGGAYYWTTMGTGTEDVLPFVPTEETTAPVQGNESLSPSDETAAIEADMDAAYMQQLEADIEADLKAIESY